MLVGGDAEDTHQKTGMGLRSSRIGNETCTTQHGANTHYKSTTISIRIMYMYKRKVYIHTSPINPHSPRKLHVPSTVTLAHKLSAAIYILHTYMSAAIHTYVSTATDIHTCTPVFEEMHDSLDTLHCRNAREERNLVFESRCHGFLLSHRG